MVLRLRVRRACRPWPTGGRQTTKRAVSVKVSADGPRLLALAVPVNQRTVPGGPGGGFCGRRAYGRARCRADGIPGGGKGVKQRNKQRSSSWSILQNLAPINIGTRPVAPVYSDDTQHLPPTSRLVRKSDFHQSPHRIPGPAALAWSIFHKLSSERDRHQPAAPSSLR